MGSFMDMYDAPVIINNLTRTPGIHFGDMTQLEMLKEFMMLSNGTITYDMLDENHIEISPLIDKWIDNSTVQMDITDKVDRSVFTMSPSTELVPKVIDIRWTKGQNFLDRAYEKEIGVGYGDVKKIHTGVEKGGKNMSIKSKASPFTTSAIAYADPDDGNQMSGMVISNYIKDNNKFDATKVKMQFSLWDGVVRELKDSVDANVNYRVQDFVGTASTPLITNKYPIFHNALLTISNGYELLFDTPDMNWESSVPYSINYDMFRGIDNNLFDNYYAPYLSSVMNTHVLDIKLRLSPIEFAGLNLYAPVFLDSVQYRILEYSDYDIMGDEATNVKLMKDDITKLR